MKNYEATATLLSNFIEDERGCWVWTMAVTPAGYGRLGDGYAHRLSYELFVDDIPQDYCIDHLCRNRACINPNHLEAVTQTANKLRGVGAPAKNALKTHCSKGHKFTSENTYSPNGKHRQCRICAYARGVKFRQANPTYNRDYLREWRTRKQYA